ncbi:retinol-DH_like_SDR_c domain-containing protein isoform X3 [Triplophysa rosa]|uniref:retinol-DH_like_SDR_c domain-containing protein isoform X3 n=1 Tax=Triplophysa rosa TaxID=992332 RepID=UPI002545DBF2|nr:retinol-DH_like_SDR_c domain-containing protein isoform X3 [Triplophysa rosa]
MITTNDMYLSISAIQLWEELNSNCLVKYGTATAVTAISLVLLRKWIAGGVCRCRVRLDGKTVVITGANTGIGKETAHDLAMRGARIVMACRDLSRAEKAAAEIRRSTGNGHIVVRHLDLASLFSVRQFAHEYVATENRLDILINNAGVMMCPKGLTEDGYETQFAVNHLGHFLVTVMLLDVLRKSTPSRVINVSSIAHKGVSGVTVYALHPGVIRTELGRYVQTRHPLIGALLSIPAILLMKTPKQGAQTTIYCAVAEWLEPHSGCYFSDCKLKEPAPEGKDDLAALRLWEVSAKLVGYSED